MANVMLNINGAQYGLLFNGNAMFDIADQFGNKEMSKIIFGAGRDGLHDLACVIATMSEQYMLAEVYKGAERSATATVELLEDYLFAPTTQPYHHKELREKAMEAVVAGYRRDIEPEGDIDLELQEIQKKSERGGKKPPISEPGHSAG